MRQPHADLVALPGGNGQDIMKRCLGPGAFGVNRGGFAVHHGAVDPVLDVGRVIRRVEYALVVRLVPGHQHRHLLFAVPPARAELAGFGAYGAAARTFGVGAQLGSLGAVSPGPRVPEPERGQDVQPGLRWAPVMHGDLQENILGRGLRVFDKDVEVPAFIEDPGIDKLIFRFVLSARAVGRD